MGVTQLVLKLGDRNPSISLGLNSSSGSSSFLIQELGGRGIVVEVIGQIEVGQSIA